MNYVQSDGRITEPMVRIGGELKPVSWREAYVYTAKKMESIKIRGEKTAISVGQTYCVEDAGAIKNLAEIFGAEVFSYANRENGLVKVLGYDASSITLAEEHVSNGIVEFGSSMLENPVILVKLRTAAKKGTPVYVITDKSDDYNVECTVIEEPNTTGFIKQITKALIDLGSAPNNALGFDELKASLDGITVSADAETIANAYKSARKAMILYSIGDLSTAAATEIANMAVVSGHIGSPRDGIYMLRQMSGSQALACYGITKTAEAAKGAKGLMVFGEDANISTDELEFLMVQDTHFTDIMNKADVVFPLVAYPEINGTFVNADGKFQMSNKAVCSPIEFRTAEIAQGIAEILEDCACEGCICDFDCSDDCESDCDGTAYDIGFPDKKARLQVIDETSIFEDLAQTSYLMNTIVAELPKPVTV
jgi:formate dehydrogenase major subunit